MHVIPKKVLQRFAEAHPDAAEPLSHWFRLARKAEWGSFAEVRETFAAADQVGKFTVFNIGENKYRLVATIHYNRGKVFVRHVLTHKDYDRGGWKDD